MIKDYLRENDIKITELASYLNLSRQSMYFFIDCYDSEKFSNVNPKVLKLFNYINEHPLAGKKAVISYILNNFVEIKDLDESFNSNALKSVRKLLIENPESKKSQFIQYIFEEKTYDFIINYLVDIIPLVNKKRLTKIEKEKLNAYSLIKESLMEGEK